MKRILSVLLALVMVIGMLPMSILSASAADTTEVVFELGANGSASHYDGTEKSTYSETVNGVALSITGGTKMYTGARDAKGNSCIKLGTSGTVGKFSFTVPSDVIEVVIYIAKYKAKTSKVSINGTTSTLTNSSDNGAYDAITVDTSATKTVSVTTVSGSARAMVNTIKFVCAAKDCEHANAETVNAVDATCTSVGYTAGKYCPDCKTYIEGHEEVAKIAHTYVNGSCSCGAEEPATYVKKDIAEITDKQKVIITMQNSGGVWALTSGNGASSAPTAVKVTVANDAIETNIENIYWNISNDNGNLTIYPAGDNTKWLYCTNDNNGVRVGEGDAKHFVIDGNYLKITETKEIRYIGIYSSSDWRCYTNTTGNIAGQTLAFYVKECAHTNTKEVTVDATCEEAGSKTVTCADCGFVISTSEIPAIGHNYVDGKCSNCDQEDPDVCKHENQTTTTVDATCTVDGSVTVTCDDCHAVMSEEVIAAPGHTEVVDEAVKATCTESGLTEGSHCSVCNEVIVAQTKIDALGHNYVDGTCDVCGEEKPAETSAAIDFSTTAQRVSQDTNSQVWSNAGLTVTNKKGTGSNVANYSNPVRFYKSSEIIIAYPQMTKIVINSAADYGTESKNLYFTNLVNDLKEGNVTTEGTTITIELDEPMDTYTITLTGGQARWYSITAYAAAGTCVHEVSKWNTTVSATCEVAGTQIGTCSKCGETVEKEIPALGHAYSYNAEAGKMVCANCGDSFMNTIAEARAYTDGNKVYYFKGIVSYVSGKTVYVQDDTAGVCVYFTNADNAAGIAAGDELLVWDTMTTYNGLVETTYTTSAEVQVLSSGNALPQAQNITWAEVLANPVEYQGERVTLRNMTMGLVNVSGNTVLTDAEGNTINLYQAKGMAANVTENDIVDITVVFSVYNNKYQLLLNQSTAATDVVVTTEGVPSDLPLSDISAAKAGTEGTFFKVKGVVTFVDGGSVYMQDATGGIVARLASGVSAPEIGTEIEALGAYTTYNGLIQLEGATFETISSGNTVAAKEVTLADLVGATNNAYLSEKVAMKGLTVTAAENYNAAYKNVDYTVTDGTNFFKLYRAPAASADTVLKAGDVINVVGVVGIYNADYQLRVVDASDIVIVPTVKMTHISLSPANDALGFKVQLNGIDPAEVTEYGVTFTVNGMSKTYTKNSLDSESISARVQGIMEAGGGEMKITGQFYVVVNGEKIYSDEQTTCMMDAIKAVNEITTLSEAQKAAVCGLYKDYASVIDAWLGETNNIKDWATTVV